MVNKDKLGSFCTIFNANNWEQYRAEASSFLLQSLPEDARVDFPSGPKTYPCLVASSYSPKDPTKANEFTYFKVECCFVYLSDAHRLLDAAASVNDSIIVEDEEDGDWPQLLPDAGHGIPAENAGEADLTILVLGMLRELHEIGALKFERLVETLPGVQEKLDEYSKTADQPEDMVDFLKELWSRMNAG